MLMNDRVSTRIKNSAVTSFSPDKEVNCQLAYSWPTIRLTIGSVVLVLNYDKDSVRDEDISRLDSAIESVPFHVNRG